MHGGGKSIGFVISRYTYHVSGESRAIAQACRCLGFYGRPVGVNLYCVRSERVRLIYRRV